MGLGKTSIDYIPRVSGISQRMQGVLIEKIIPLLAIVSLYHNCYPGAKIRYLAGYPTLVNCIIIDLSGIFSIEETRHQALGLPSLTTLETENHM